MIVEAVAHLVVIRLTEEVVMEGPAILRKARNTSAISVAYTFLAY